jgi:hypothetical protein
MLPILPIGLAALTLAAGGSSGRSPCPGADRMPAAGMAAAATATRCLVNRERADAGVRPLVDEAHLRRAATTE